MLQSKEYFRWEYSLTTFLRLIAVAFVLSPPADLILQTGKESIEPMDSLSLALAMLAWVLIALLSLFVGIIVLRALRHVTVLMRWTLRSGLDKSSGRSSRHE